MDDSSTNRGYASPHETAGTEPPRTSTSDVENDVAIREALEDYAQQLDSGVSPDPEAFISQHPELADSLRVHLRALVAVHRVSRLADWSGSESATSTSDDHLDRVVPRSHEKLGDFRLIRLIGRGGMGIVYEAEQLSLGRVVAVKVMPFAAMLDERNLKRFRNEARAAATLDHPNIVPIYFVGNERGVHFFAMQLIEGCSLAEVIGELKRDHPELERDHSAVSQSGDTVTSPDDSDDRSSTASSMRLEQRERPDQFFRTVARIGAEAAEALEHAHSLGVLHRDVKPGNLLIDKTGKVYVADFGLATVPQEETITRTGGVVGTAAYMSPEQAIDSRRVDARSDVYSLGATLLELTTLGRVRQRRDAKQSQVDPADLLRAAARVSKRRVPRDLETIIRKAISSDAADRYDSAGNMAADLRRFQDNQPIVARPLRSVERAYRWTRRHPRIATAVAAMLLIIGIVSVAVNSVLTIARRDVARALRKSEQQAENLSDLLYVSDVQAAYRAWGENRADQVNEILARYLPAPGQPDRRGYEWHLLKALVREPQATIIGSHSGSANALAVFDDGRRVASVGDDGNISIWDIERGEAVQTIETGDNSLHAVAVSPDSRLIATGTNNLKLWDLTTGELLSGALFKHPTTIESIAFSPDGSLLLSGSRYERVGLVTIEGEMIASIEDSARHESVGFSTNGQRVLIPSRNHDPPNPEEGMIRIWDRRMTEIEDEWGPSDNVRDFTLATASPDGRFYAASSRYAHRHTAIYFA